MIFEGPLVFALSWNPMHLFLDLDDGNVHATVPASPLRVDRWVRAAVHVPQRPGLGLDMNLDYLRAHAVDGWGDQGR